MRTFLSVICVALATVICVACGEKDEFVSDPFYEDTIPEKIVAQYVDIPAYVDTIMSVSRGLYVNLLLKEDVCLCDGGDIVGCYRNNFNDFVGVSTDVLLTNNIPYRSKVVVSIDITNINVFKKEFETWGGASNPDRITAPKAYIKKISVR